MPDTRLADGPLVNPKDMQIRAAEVALHLKALAHPVRLMLVCILAEGEYSVGTLEQRLGVRQPTLSQQLTVLRDAAIVEPRRDGKQIYYRLIEKKTDRLMSALQDIFGLGLKLE